MGNGKRETRKWEESTLHFTQQTADILLLQSSNVMRKFVHPAFIERIIYTLQFAPKRYTTALNIASWWAS